MNSLYEKEEEEVEEVEVEVDGLCHLSSAWNGGNREGRGRRKNRRGDVAYLF